MRKIQVENPDRAIDIFYALLSQDFGPDDAPDAAGDVFGSAGRLVAEIEGFGPEVVRVERAADGRLMSLNESTDELLMSEKPVSEAEIEAWLREMELAQ